MAYYDQACVQQHSMMGFHDKCYRRFIDSKHIAARKWTVPEETPYDLKRRIDGKARGNQAEALVYCLFNLLYVGKKQYITRRCKRVQDKLQQAETFDGEMERPRKRQCTVKEAGYYKKLLDGNAKLQLGKPRSTKLSWKEGDLFDIEILEETDDQVYITYPGWDKQFDHWLPKTDVVEKIHNQDTISLGSLPERSELFTSRLRLDIKRQLVGRRKEDPKIVIVRDIERDIYDSTQK
ncbi:hypothetical protein BSL78_26369 [Apostichopus japonicus]|uniref:Chromo domain-containing protein n=1 Tax=Stichopus japonicus TaxID=307972 RepID=A0A2G8JM13_STIJA|nr:hypothetical protein BSL78_26369 [Apostichopus japonicus]